MANKGGPYEREVCRRLTLWWTGDPGADTLWWRTSQSGGRATFRSRKGKKTGKAHVGDIAAIEPEGRFWSELVTTEIKRGYPNATLAQIFDLPFRVKGRQPLHDFLLQTLAAQERAGTPYWAVIHRRDNRDALIYFDSGLLLDLQAIGVLTPPRPDPFARVELRIPNGGSKLYVAFAAMQFEDFLDVVTPADIRALHAARFGSQGRV